MNVAKCLIFNHQQVFWNKKHHYIIYRAMGLEVQNRYLFSLVWALLCMAKAQQELSLFYAHEEEQPPGLEVGSIKTDAHATLANEFTAAEQQKLTFQFLTPRPAAFVIDETTGVIRTATRLDREALCPTPQPYCALQAEVAVQCNFKVIIFKVSVTILDVNDNAPQFPSQRVTMSLSESAAVGTTLAIQPAHDPDIGPNAVRSYELTSSTGQDFDLQAAKKNDGSVELRLVLIKQLDRELLREHHIQVTASDGGSPALTGTVDIVIEVKDANDNAPVFEQSSYQVTVQENLPALTTIARIRATDVDEGLNGKITYSLSAQTQKLLGDTFAIQNMTGVLYNLRPLDYERAAEHVIYVRANDQAQEPITSEVMVRVKIDDVNDNAPDVTVSALKTSNNGDAVEIMENMAPNNFVARIMATDKDSGGSQVNCTMKDPAFKLLKLAEGKYELQLGHVTLDREKKDSYSLKIMCQDRGSPPLVTTKNIQIVVLDDNDNTPTFDRKRYEASIFENSYQDAFVLKVNATDADVGPNGAISYRLSDSAAGMFRIEESTGIIRAVTSLDRESVHQAVFHVYAIDSGDVRRTGTADVIVTIQDTNDERPAFTTASYTFTVSESVRIGTIVGNVSASDADGSPYNVVSYLALLTGSASGIFHVDSASGVITLHHQLDRERQERHTFAVVARDSGIPPLSGTASVTVIVSDVNDNAPKFTFPSPHNHTVSVSNDVRPGRPIAEVTSYDADADRNAEVYYKILSGGGNYFIIDPAKGIVIANEDLGHIEQETFVLEIEASNPPGLGFASNLNPQSSSALLIINVNRSLSHAVGQGYGSALGLDYIASLFDMSEEHLVAIATVVLLTVIVVVTLAIAIICIVRGQDRRRKQRRYNCRTTEALRAATMTSSKSPPTPDGANGGLLVVSCDASGDVSNVKTLPVHDVSTLPRLNYDVMTSMGRGVSGAAITGSRPDVCDCASLNKFGGSPRPSVNDVILPANHLEARESEIDYLMDKLRHDSDNGSIPSADGSNADSGHGPSETGDTRHMVCPPLTEPLAFGYGHMACQTFKASSPSRSSNSSVFGRACIPPVHNGGGGSGGGGLSTYRQASSSLHHHPPQQHPPASYGTLPSSTSPQHLHYQQQRAANMSPILQYGTPHQHNYQHFNQQQQQATAAGQFADVLPRQQSTSSRAGSVHSVSSPVNHQHGFVSASATASPPPSYASHVTARLANGNQRPSLHNQS